MCQFLVLVRGEDVLRKCIYFGVVLGLAWLFMQMPTGPVFSQQQNPAAALEQIEEGQPQEGDQRLESLDGLSDQEVRDIYLNRPWLLPNELTDADQEKIDRIIRLVHPIEGENDGS